MSDNVNGQPSAAQTPSAQQQHNPPSLPTSPHPKRVKTDDLLNPADPVNTNTVPIMSDPAQAATPTPSNAPISLPSMSSLLPGASIPLTAASNPNAIAAPLPTAAMIPPPQAAPPLLVQKLSEHATTPTRGSAFAAGYDLYAAAPLVIPSKGKGLISTAISIAVPVGTYGRIAPRSGLASKHFLDTGAGVIDADYRGEVKVLLFNFSDVDYEIKQGERVAQLVLERIVTPDVLVVEQLEESVRGAGGFGSTGYA